MYPDSDSIICWRGVEIPRFPAHFGYCYLLHFAEPYKHACHYLGSCISLDFRLAQHRAGTGARLLQVVNDAGITWEVSRIWRCDTPELARLLEARLKRRSNDKRLCPICQHRPLDPQALLYAGHWPFHVYTRWGRRQPLKGGLS